MINYVKGNICCPEDNAKEGIKIIVNFTNDVASYNTETTKALSKRWFRLRNDLATYRNSYRVGDLCNYRTYDNDIYVANVFVQHGYEQSPVIHFTDMIFNPQSYADYLNHKTSVRLEPARCDLILNYLKKLKYRYGYSDKKVSIHLSRENDFDFETWIVIEHLVCDVFKDSNMEVYLYNF